MVARPQVRLLVASPVQLPDGTVIRLFDHPNDNDHTIGGFDVAPGNTIRPDGTGKKVVALFGGKPGRDREAWRGEIEVKAGDAVQEIELPIGPDVIDKLRALLDRGK
jgi:hypothetical protein